MAKKITIERKPLNISGRRSIKKLPRLETMFEDEGDPLEDVDYDPEDLERSADNEMTEIVKKIKADKKALQDTFRVGRDPEYWVALCFQSREQRDQFLQAAGWADLGDKYLNGLEIARRLGVDVQPIDIKPLPMRGKAKNYKREEVI